MSMLTLLCSLKKDWFVVTLYVLYKSQILGGGGGGVNQRFECSRNIMFY